MRLLVNGIDSKFPIEYKQNISPTYDSENPLAIASSGYSGIGKV
jgi:hypothetical protein